jgi:GNAT superfamily N-acetyltransferase
VQTQAKIRPAQAGERLALIELQRAASLASGTYRDVLLAHPEVIDLPLEQIETGRVHVADAGGAVRGFYAVLEATDGAAELDGLFVDPTYWRQGIGHRLLQEAERQAVAEGATLLCVTANPDALQFYQACGLTVVGEVQTQFDVALRLQKKLPSP